MRFPPGSVGETLTLMQGVWHDHIQLFNLDGDPLERDQASGTPGKAPYDNLVYIEFDGEIYRQTNVTFRGRPLHVRSFGGVLQNQILRFKTLGPDDPSHIGVSGGPGRLIFAPQNITPSWERYAEPDFIQLLGPGQRQRVTLLYRQGKAVRTLLATGTKISPFFHVRLPLDPRGPDGPVHEEISQTFVFSEKKS
jgi:hypothetical protein